MNNITSLYLHFPYCLHLCNYCDFYKHKFEENSHQIEQFNQLIDKSFALHEKFLEKYNKSLSPLESLYFGGGTPSLWGLKGINFLEKNIIGNKIQLKNDCEFTIEIDPGTISLEEIKRWQDIGVNRFSVGVQSLDDKFLQIMDRKHGREEIFSLLEILNKLNLNFSVDFMLGLPFSLEKQRNIILELQELMNFNPSHLSLYILATRKNYLYNKNLPDGDFAADEYLTVVNYLKDLGFEHYEVSNFSKKGFESKHNLKYWACSEVASIGPNATGLIHLENSQIRYKWRPQEAGIVEEKLNQNQIMIEKIYMNLRSKIGLDLSKVFGAHLPQGLKNDLSGWKQDGLLIQSGDSIFLNSKGFLILDSIIAKIIGYL
jgi:oxygen-independent coproporphyrinogen-3 oxidase